VEDEFGLLHILVNCAAVAVAGVVSDIEAGDLERIINVNIKGYIHTTTHAIPLMRKAGYGRLIHINSSSGLKASAGMSLYSASKYCNRGFAISTALEVGKDNITSNSVCPSDVYPEGELEAKSWREDSLLQTSLSKEGVTSLEELIQRRSERNPMGRSCTREDIVNLVLFLASEQAGFINGQSIGVNGGQIPY
jgi:NAD(P)-dependent dehydrogenase (short-subunit alcohol dehydrogenase family)